MTFDPDKHHRRSIRLEDYDYSWAGAYFVTICVQHLACLFGEICNDQVIPNPAGIPVQSEWDALPRRFPSLELDAFVLMPNHVHGIVVITEETWTSADVDPRTRAARVRDPDVGATLVVAQSADDEAREGTPPQARAGTRPAPTSAETRDVNVRPTPVRPEPVERVVAQSARAGTRPAPTLGDIVGAFKSLTTHRYVIGVRDQGWAKFQRRLWQRNYYQHIIRNHEELTRIRQYIADNPAQWMADRENPDRSVSDTAGKPDERDDIARLFGGVRP